MFCFQIAAETCTMWFFKSFFFLSWWEKNLILFVLKQQHLLFAHCNRNGGGRVLGGALEESLAAVVLRDFSSFKTLASLLKTTDYFYWVELECHKSPLESSLWNKFCVSIFVLFFFFWVAWWTFKTPPFFKNSFPLKAVHIRKQLPHTIWKSMQIENPKLLKPLFSHLDVELIFPMYKVIVKTI